MAELVLSAVLPILIEKLVSETSKNIARYKGIGAEVNKWQGWLNQIQRVLVDASRKEITEEAVKEWLDDLQHLAYDIDDVLDRWAIDAMHREIPHESEAFSSKVKKLIPSCCTNFSPSIKMYDELDSINTRLEHLVKQKDALGLKVEELETRTQNIYKNRKLETSIVEASKVVGREEVKKELVDKLLSGGSSDENFSIVPIVGMGGVGKTTLANLVYEEVKNSFDLKAWVCVSDEFDNSRIGEVIFQSVTGEDKKFSDFNQLQEALIDHLRGKRFLLLLDDVWSDTTDDWDILVRPFHVCATGSKIIMTTRKDKLLKELGYGHLIQPLSSLSDEDALSFVARQALGVNNFDSHLSLKPHAQGIVKKCDGLPLALIAVARSLMKKEDEYSWKKVLESEIWRSKDGKVLPALKLSYHELFADLKRLFAYCSLFPKDCVFDKEDLVRLWMAEGFLCTSSVSDTEESLGHDNFDELLARSFFQHAPNDKSSFVMHDLMHDLATYVAGKFFVRLHNDEKKDTREKILEKYRHMSFVRGKYIVDNKFEAFKRATKLRTFLATSDLVLPSWQTSYLSSNNILVDLLGGLPLLRVLSLSGVRISEVPESVIGTLRHLRYLNLSRTDITCLPENVCNLCNLQTLILFGCDNLVMLPNSFSKLTNLQHFDVRDTPLLNKMPLGIDELKGLQTLSKIIIGGEHGFEISKLREFNNLHGEISILGLDNVQNATNVRKAKFSQKRLSVLEVVWSDVFDGSRNEVLEKDVLNELQPHSDYLKQLKIVSYGGLEFPTWIGGSSFLQLKQVSIRDCKICTSLPPLGQLPVLRELFIKGLVGVKVVGMELLGTSTDFRSLEVLSFESMSGWEKWSNNSGVVFPCLRQLKIKDCPNLVEVEVSVGALTSLNNLELDACDSDVLRRLVQVASPVTKLTVRRISRLNDMVWRGVIEYLETVEELRIEWCHEIRYLWESETIASKYLVKLRKLVVWNCGRLVSLGEKVEDDKCRSGLLTSLKMLEVISCRSMESCSCPQNIDMFIINNCNSVITLSLPPGQKLKLLRINHCKKLSEREWRGHMLEHVRFRNWQNLKSIIELNNLVHLTTLKIRDCKSLETFPENELPSLTALKELEILNCSSMSSSFSCGIWPPKLQFLKIGGLKKPISEWGPQKFPTSLISLFLNGRNDRASSCSQFSHLLPSSLTSLYIDEFENLASVSVGLQHLTSLQHLTFWDCPNMMDLPEMLMPSFLSLRIYRCPKLKESCSERGSYWPLISRIPCFIIRNPNEDQEPKFTSLFAFR